ncbi:MAG: hypothetical protein AB1489_24100, partial [Acidobacteriota bacterium]
MRRCDYRHLIIICYFVRTPYEFISYGVMMVFSPWIIVVAILIYMVSLFVIAQMAERRAATGKNWANSAIVYSFAIFSSQWGSWAYYGSPNTIIEHGLSAYSILITMNMSLIFGRTVLKRAIKLKDLYKITSIADFISARYGKSQIIAIIVTSITIFSTIPILAAYIRVISETSTLITNISDNHSLVSSSIRPIVVVSMILFTVILGMRRLDPTERHPGIVVAMASESVIRLVAWLVVSLFVVLVLFGGIEGLHTQLSKGLLSATGLIPKTTTEQICIWLTYAVLGIVLFSSSPKIFYLTVIENNDQKHISTAMWLYPLKVWLLGIFLLPISLAGMLYCPKEILADKYLLSLPLQYGQGMISLLVFMGGFSIATGLIIVETVTIATMLCNHLLIPIIENCRWIWSLRRHLLVCRWIAAAILILVGYWFEVSVGKSTALSNLGIIALSACLIYAPVLLIGLFWQRANKMGTIIGLSSGVLVWLYVMVTPVLAKTGIINPSILTNGPLGLPFLRPTALFGLTGLPFLTNAVLWVLIFTIVPYVLGSLLYIPSSEESRLAEEFVGKASTLGYVDQGEANITLSEKEQELEAVLSRYYPAS